MQDAVNRMLLKSACEIAGFGQIAFDDGRFLDE
jgi:hypothetical protein